MIHTDETQVKFLAKARYFQKTHQIIFLPFGKLFFNVGDFWLVVSKFQKDLPKRRRYDLTIVSDGIVVICFLTFTISRH